MTSNKQTQSNTFIADIFIELLKAGKANKMYSQLLHKNGLDFIDAAFETFKILYHYNENEIKRIPLNGSFIVISNHPFGGMDSMMLLRLLHAVRPDFKMLPNSMLQKVEPLKDFFLEYNPFETKTENIQGYSAIKSMLVHLEKGSPLGLFPSGNVSSYQKDIKTITDRAWKKNVLKFIKHANVPIVPIYFSGNTKLFQQLRTIIKQPVRLNNLQNELLKKQNHTINVRIGQPISLADQDSFTDLATFGRFLRAKTYALGSSYEIKRFFKKQNITKKNITPETIIEPVEQSLIENEIQSISDLELFKSNNYSIYIAPSERIENILIEIARLREITFREVGEGTNKKMDIDEYDLYYHHLFIWDNNNKKITGAYRIGKGKDIIAQYGKQGFYIHSLFKIKSSFVPILKQSIELGRSFVIKEYQQRPLSLFLLWKGILYFLLKNIEYRYLIGPVSISDNFSKFSKALIIKFVEKNYFNISFAEHVKPRNKFKINYKNIDSDILLDLTKKDINKLDKFIEDIDPSHSKIPVLLKKYIKQNAQIIGFNIDPKFNDCLDGLMVLDLFNVPKDTIKSLAKELNDSDILNRFNN